MTNPNIDQMTAEARRLWEISRQEKDPTEKHQLAERAFDLALAIKRLERGESELPRIWVSPVGSGI